MPPASPLAASDRVFDPSWHRTSRDQQGEGGARRFCGSTTVTANSSGMRTGEIRYKAYGASRYTYGTTPTTYHFTGQREEGAIGLYYYGARWYDPALGRFVQADSIIPNGAYPQDFNRYAYTRNNPVKFIDSSGHWVESALDIAGIAWDIYDIKQEGLNWKTGGALALDIAFLILPIATGGGAIVRGISHADEVGGAARAVARLDDVGDTGKALDALADTAKTLDKADDAAGSAKVAAKGTRSPGRLGGPAHQAKVADIQTDMKLRKLDVKTEFHVKTPGGEKGARFIDVAGIDRSTGKVVEFHQVGQATRAGRPVARERRAIEDIKRFGGQYSDISIAFHEY